VYNAGDNSTDLLGHITLLHDHFEEIIFGGGHPMQVGDFVKWVPMSIGDCEEEEAFHWPGYHESHIYGGPLLKTASDGWGPKVVTVKLPASGSPYGLCTKEAGEDKYTFQEHVNAIVNYEPPSSPPPPDAPPPPSPPSIQVVVGDFFTAIRDFIVGIFTQGPIAVGVAAVEGFLQYAYKAGERTMPGLGVLEGVVAGVGIALLLRQIYFCINPDARPYSALDEDEEIAMSISPSRTPQERTLMSRRIKEERREKNQAEEEAIKAKARGPTNGPFGLVGYYVRACFDKLVEPSYTH